MHILASILISALMVFGSVVYTQETKTPALGASQTISSLTAGTSLDDADILPYTETGTLTTKKITWGNATSTLQSWFSTIYSPIFSTSAGLSALLSDETGSGGGIVRATAPTITTPSLTTPTLDLAGADATGDLYYNGGSGVMTRLGIGAGTSYYLRSSAGGVPEWDNSVATFPYNASSTFTSTVHFASTTRHSGTSTFEAGVVGLIDVQTFTASSSWIKPTGVSTSSMMMIELWGGGGGGGGTTGAGAGSSGAGGGGSYTRHYMLTSSATSTVFCRVGAGGLGGASGANDGSAGATTTFGTYAEAYGGGGGGYGNGAGNNGGGGGGGGLASGGTSNTNSGGVAMGGGIGAITTGDQDGFAGGYGVAYNGGTNGSSVYGGGGGARGNSTNGGRSIYGGGGGNGGTSVFAGAGGAFGNNTNGSNGTAPSGGGGAVVNSGSNWAGGNGANGQCRITIWK